MTYSSVFPKFKSIVSHFYTETFFPFKTKIDLKSFQIKFNDYIEEYLSEKLAKCKEISDDPLVVDIVEHAISLISQGGKRVRPYVFYVTYVNEGGVNTEAAIRLSVALELFHGFALIHDDIIDRGTERHGRLTTHAYAKNLIKDFPRGDKGHIADSLALLVGDLIFSWSQEIISSFSNQDVKIIFPRMINEVLAGQMMDVSFMLKYEVSSSSIMRKNELKTALYSFVNPMLMGSAYADSHTHDVFYAKFGRLIGQAFQIQDDLLDVLGNSKKTGKNTFSDVKDGQHTLLSQYIFENGDVQAKDLLLSLFGKELNDHSRDALGRLFISSGAIDFASKKVSSFIQEARVLINHSNLKLSHQKRWNDFVDLLENRNA